MPMPVDSDSPSFPDSPDDAQIMAYLLHRDSPDERAAFEKQLQQSDLLKVRVYELASLLQRLHSIPDAEPPGDLADRILRAVGTSLPKPGPTTSPECVSVTSCFESPRPLSCFWVLRLSL